MRRLVIVAALALTLAGCAHAEAQRSRPRPSPSTSPSPSPPPSDGGTYDTPRALVDAVSTHGGPQCNGFTNTGTGANWPTATCTDAGGSTWLVVTVPDGTDVTSVVDQLSGTADDERGALVGVNWLIVFSNTGQAVTVQASVGGQITTLAAKPKPKLNVIPGDGTFLVPAEAKPGTYRSVGGETCYWARLRNLTGGVDSILANGNPSGPAIVTILPRDKGFQTQGCGEWTKVH